MHGLPLSTEISVATETGRNGTNLHWDADGRKNFTDHFPIAWIRIYMYERGAKLLFHECMIPQLWSAFMRYCDILGFFFFFFSITVQCSRVEALIFCKGNKRKRHYLTMHRSRPSILTLIKHCIDTGRSYLHRLLREGAQSSFWAAQ